MEETKVKQIIELLSIYQSTDLSELTEEDRELIKYDLEEKKKNLDDQLSQLYEKGANPIDDAEEVNLMEATVRDIEEFIENMETSSEDTETEEIIGEINNLADENIEVDNINLENEIREELASEELSDEEIIDQKLKELEDEEENFDSQVSVNQFADSETLGADFEFDDEDDEEFFNNLDLEDNEDDKAFEEIESLENDEETFFNNLEIEDETTEEIVQEESLPDEIIQQEETVQNEIIEEESENEELEEFGEETLYDADSDNESLNYGTDFEYNIEDVEYDEDEDIEYADEEYSEYNDKYDDDEYEISDEEEFTIRDDSIYEEDDLKELESDNNRMMKIFSAHPNNQSLDSAKNVVDERIGLTIEEVTMAGEKISNSLMRKIASSNVNKK